VVLRPRDEALLCALARFRIARTGDLTELFFRGVRRDTASARLRRLHDSGFIEARSAGLSEQNVYCLGPEGLYWAEERGIAAGTPPLEPASHHLAIVRLWARLAAALAANEAMRLTRFEPDWELRAKLAGSGAPVVPDAAIEIVPRQPGLRAAIRIALEVDLTTERLGALRRKLAVYEVSRIFAGSDPVSIASVLVGAGGRRLASVRSLLERAWRSETHVLLGSEWPAALLQQLHRAPLADTPIGKGKAMAATLRSDAGSQRQGEGLSPSCSSLGSADDE